MSKVIDKVDVIAEFKHDGSIIPMRLRIMNEDGEYEAFTIKAYKEVQNNGTHTTEDGIFICSDDIVFHCKIVTQNTEKVVRLYFHPKNNSWVLGF